MPEAPPTGRILVIGSANVDLITRVPHLPARGETVTGGTFQQAMGGKGANQAVAARRAGAAVSLVTSIGTDSYGTDVIDAMRTERIDTTHTRTDPDNFTGVALILVDDAGENSIAVASGANFSLLPDHLPDVFATFSGFSILVLQNELLPDTLAATLDAAGAANLPTLLNYAPAGKLPLPQLAGLRVTLIVNRAEASALLGTTLGEELSASDAAVHLQQVGFAAAIVTLGEQGSVCAVAGSNGESVLTIPAMPVKTVDTTAAGDSFCGALAAELVRDIPLAQALRFASAAGALATTRHGTQPSIPNRRQIEAALATWQR